MRRRIAYISTKTMTSKSWKYAAIPMIFVVLLAFYPQLNFWAAKGSDWNGAYYVCNFDEVAYSAYVEALINGKPRKYDPYLAAESDHESFYSIQFVPAYSIAMPARLLGLNASVAFMILIILSAAFSALFIFWLLQMVTGDELLSAAGVCVICCLGALIAYEGELRNWIEGRLLVDFLPFLRRYQPGFAFPLFFLFCGLVWRSLTDSSRKNNYLFSLLSGIAFAALVFSYFFLWTAAAAWLGCVYVLYLMWNRAALKVVLINLGFVGGCAVAALIPYFIMLSGRAPHVDSVQLLASTHMPDYESLSLAVGLVVVLGIAVFAWRGRMKMSSPQTLFTVAFAIAPLVLLNQQVITGRSLQPVHYEIFISNYLVLTALVLFLSLIFKQTAGGEGARPIRRAVIYIGVVAACWGIVEASGSTNRNNEFADLRDKTIPAIRHIADLEKQKPQGTKPAAVFAVNTGMADFIPTIADLRPLWSSHSTSAGGIDIAENKRLFYLFLYYAGYDENDVSEGLRAGAFEITAALFGSERALPELGKKQDPITSGEIAAESRLYGDFARNFSKGSASDPVLSYVIINADGEPNLTNLDRWYQRDAGTVTGTLKVYNVVLKP